MNGLFVLFKWEVVFRDFSIFFEGFVIILEVVVLGFLFVLILGVIFGVLFISKIKIFRVISRIYVEII